MYFRIFSLLFKAFDIKYQKFVIKCEHLMEDIILQTEGAVDKDETLLN